MEKTYTEEWDFYLCTVENKTASISIDLGYSRIAPVKRFENMVWVSINLLNPGPDGLSSSEEFDTLAKLEDALTVNIKQSIQAVQVGRMTSEGKRIFYFYTQNLDQYGTSIAYALCDFPDYKYNFGLKRDKEWKTYFDFLMPQPEQYQGMLNRRVIHNLETQGDNLLSEREVEHWINFKTELDRDIFLVRIKNDGFKVMNKYFDERYPEAPYSIQLSRLDTVDQDSVDGYVIDLYRKAIECKGYYNGWGTQVVK